VLSVGADHAIDYTRDDFTTQSQRFDLIVAVAGNRSIFDYKRALNPGGTYICIGGSMKQYFQAMLLGPILSVGSDFSMGSSGWVKPDREDFDFLLQLIKTGRLLPVVDRTFPLSETPEALRYYGEGKAHGKVVITIKQNL
jgi:NADPH:quinone reductase-like Zn-dependent oxidoreductase